MDIQTFILFAVTTLVVVFSPGPAAITVAGQGAGNGYARAVFGIFGVAFANAVYFALSAFGIASLIIASHTAFNIIKWIGVSYLVYIGVSAIFGKSGGLKIAKGPKASRRKCFLTGFVVEFANPKALLYFAAILPQFVNPDAAIAPQLLIMGLATIIIDVSIYTVYAFMGAKLARSGAKPRLINTINNVAGGALLFAAFKMARVSAA